MMKLSIIRNELHNVINGQLRRVEAEVGTLTRKLQLIEEDLEKSEVSLGTATTDLAAVTQDLDETEEIRSALEEFGTLEESRLQHLLPQLPDSDEE
jgi:DNA anti-recombination protein RmuC